MTTKITREMVDAWHNEWKDLPISKAGSALNYVAKKAADWAADQELEACCQYIGGCGAWFANPGFRLAELRAARRLKPPSLKEQALAVLQKQIDKAFKLSDEAAADAYLIRRALESIPDEPERTND